MKDIDKKATVIEEKLMRAAMWNIAFAIWTEKNRPEMQDIPTRIKEGD